MTDPANLIQSKIQKLNLLQSKNKMKFCVLFIANGFKVEQHEKRSTQSLCGACYS